MWLSIPRICPFSFFGGSKLVNAEPVKRKLLSLLVDGTTTKKKSWNSFMRYRCNFEQLKKKIQNVALL
jgi:hypothetical protein